MTQLFTKIKLNHWSGQLLIRLDVLDRVHHYVLDQVHRCGGSEMKKERPMGSSAFKKSVLLSSIAASVASQFPVVSAGATPTDSSAVSNIGKYVGSQAGVFTDLNKVLVDTRAGVAVDAIGPKGPIGVGKAIQISGLSKAGVPLGATSKIGRAHV